MTEPDHGCDLAGGINTPATKTVAGWTLNSTKRWIGADTFADFALVWAKDTSDDCVKEFLVRMDLPGITIKKIQHKTGLRVMQKADITFEHVEIHAEDALPGAVDFGAANELLRNSRGMGWIASVWRPAACF